MQPCPIAGLEVLHWWSAWKDPRAQGGQDRGHTGRPESPGPRILSAGPAKAAPSSFSSATAERAPPENDQAVTRGCGMVAWTGRNPRWSFIKLVTASSQPSRALPARELPGAHRMGDALDLALEAWQSSARCCGTRAPTAENFRERKFQRQLKANGQVKPGEGRAHSPRRGAGVTGGLRAAGWEAGKSEQGAGWHLRRGGPVRGPGGAAGTAVRWLTGKPCQPLLCPSDTATVLSGSSWAQEAGVPAACGPEPLVGAVNEDQAPAKPPHNHFIETDQQRQVQRNWPGIKLSGGHAEEVSASGHIATCPSDRVHADATRNP